MDLRLPPTIVPGPAGRGGYRRLVDGPVEAHRTRTDLGGAAPAGRLRSLLAFGQVSDLHVVDGQSPSRAEYLARLGDDDSPIAEQIGPLGTYRPQEALSHHVVEAMTATLRADPTGPVTGAPLAFVVSTGDAADNAQANEIDASIALLQGDRTVGPDSGDRSRWEGVGGADDRDPRYWHPDGPPAGQPADRPTAHFGFPTVPGLLDAARRPWPPAGLGLPWYPVHGNHDHLVAGTLLADETLRRLSRGRRKATSTPAALSPGDILALLADSERQPPDLFAPLARGSWRTVSPDPGRGQLSTAEWVAAHIGRSARPVGRSPWYAFDAGPVRALVLDTVNPNGGWQGSIDADQLAWIEHELESASSRWVDRNGRLRRAERDDRLVVLFSHHPLSTLVNSWAPDGRHRALAPEVEAVLGRFPNLVAWINGHTHTNTVTAHPGHRAAGADAGWWEVTTASHIDWPQQARIFELAEDPATGELVLACTVVDHRGLVDPRTGPLEQTRTLAGWSRELAANDWQRRHGDAEASGRGRPLDRNVILSVPAGLRSPTPVP